MQEAIHHVFPPLYDGLEEKSIKTPENVLQVKKNTVETLGSHSNGTIRNITNHDCRQQNYKFISLLVSVTMGL